MSYTVPSLPRAILTTYAHGCSNAPIEQEVSVVSTSANFVYVDDGATTVRVHKSAVRLLEV